jgi:hypothetical protein
VLRQIKDRFVLSAVLSLYALLAAVIRYDCSTSKPVQLIVL